MIFEPFFIAKFAPNFAPNICMTPITMPIFQLIAPKARKTANAPRLEAKFKSLVWAVAFSTPYPAKEMKASIKKEPVPGPNIPS